jgi:hypothetical protein
MALCTLLPYDAAPHARGRHQVVQRTQGQWTHERCVQQDYRWHIFGGTGMIMSAALLEALDARDAEYTDCINASRAGGACHWNNTSVALLCMDS